MTAPSPATESPPTLSPTPKPPRLFRRAYDVLKAEPRATLLPLLVTQVPLAIAAAVAYFVLFFRFYDDFAFDSFTALRHQPDGLNLSISMLVAIYLLFTAVGVTATITAVNAALSGRRLGLTAALDPSFTRLGGLLLLGMIFQVMFALTTLGVFILIYVIFRFGLAFHVYILENLGVWPSLKRSWALLRRGVLRFVGSLVVPSLLVLAAVAAAVMVLSLISLPFVSTDAGRTERLILSTVELALFGIVAAPCGAYFAAVTTILYLDLKGRANV